MKILKTTENELNILAGDDLTVLIYYLCVITIPVGLFLLLALLINMFGLLIGASDSIWGSLFRFIVFVFVWMWAVGAYSIKNYLLFKNMKTIEIHTKPIWKIWAPPVRSYSFQDLKAVVVEGDREGIRLKLAVKSGVLLNMGSKTYDNKDETSLSDLGQLLSSFTEIPLQINIGPEKIIKFPNTSSENIFTAPLNCSRCGGQLPLITSSMRRVACDYCGTVSMVMWDDK